ncbi:MAG TPA: Hsp20/alpha crystallin family protein [Gemmatimonadaceae bacterium]|jgi:HSP20 family molecular chaperone IbpA|nr:MAG: hypothetical protein ABS52_10115 [Gemmatimonadetes bacterium SCN 70-22]HMN09042.1 Hsp20/alpha crystallin family protein [Gemmatimonadaceae bacterium]
MTRQLLPRTTPIFSSALREMDEMQNRLLRMFNQPPMMERFPMETVGWMPPVEIVEKPDALVLTAELPGLDGKDLDVSFEADILTIRGEKLEEKREEKEEPKFHMFERYYGSFSRSFTLPRRIDPARITAEFRNGVLVVTMPKASDDVAKGRKIEVKAGK